MKMKEKFYNEEMIDRELEKLYPEMTDNKPIDVDRAWNKVWSRMNEGAPVIKMNPAIRVFTRSGFMKIAAAILILIGLGTAAIFTFNSDSLSKTIIASTGDDHKNQKISLSDGSTVTL